MIQETIEALLKEKVGLAASILGSGEIARSVERRRIACGLPDLPTYFQLLQTSTKEFEELVELVIVPETWFFRDWEPFVFLERYVTSEWLPTQRHRILRLLSVPCSSGEEPYSIAMTLINAGLTPNQFRIDAVDISKNSLLRAKEAIYNQNSFRGNNLEFQKRYFTKKDDKYQLCDLVKNAVNFMSGNLVETDFLREKSPYNIIFCRNVLIYFERSTREQSFQNLNRLLAKEGLLFLGHAETSQILDSGFVSVRHPFAFAYRKEDNKDDKIKNGESLALKNKVNFSPNYNLNSSQRKPAAQLFEIAKPGKPQNSLREKPSSPEIETIPLSKPKEANSKQTPSLNFETARKLADSGQLDEAAKLCETYLKENSTSVEAYLLLGEIHQARGFERQAEQCFQKAIYLEPNNYEALLHLCLLKEHRGDMAGATVLRQRIQRLPKS